MKKITFALIMLFTLSFQQSKATSILKKLKEPFETATLTLNNKTGHTIRVQVWEDKELGLCDNKIFDATIDNGKAKTAKAHGQCCLGKVKITTPDDKNEPPLEANEYHLCRKYGMDIKWNSQGWWSWKTNSLHHLYPTMPHIIQ